MMTDDGGDAREGVVDVERACETGFVFTLRAPGSGPPGAAGGAAAAGEEEARPRPPAVVRGLWRWHARFCSTVARNDFFQLARPTALALGGGAGSAGWALSLDAGLERGASRPCTTFGTPASLAGGSKGGGGDDDDGAYEVGRVELWGLR